MNSAQTIVDCATEKRRLNPDYSLSLAELKAVDVVVTAQIRASAKLRAGVDLGTSPHGLSVELAEPVQETRKESSFSPPAKPVLILPDAVSTAWNVETCQRLKQNRRNGAHRSIIAGAPYPAVLLRTEQNGDGQSGIGISPGVYRFTEEQRCALSFAALCEAEELQAGYEAHMPEVQEAIERLREARSILEEVSA